MLGRVVNESRDLVGEKSEVGLGIPVVFSHYELMSWILSLKIHTPTLLKIFIFLVEICREQPCFEG